MGRQPRLDAPRAELERDAQRGPERGADGEGDGGGEETPLLAGPQGRWLPCPADEVEHGHGPRAPARCPPKCVNDELIPNRKRGKFLISF